MHEAAAESLIAKPMKKGTSLYLDLVRFSAAMVVFLEHLREHTRDEFSAFWSRHPFWSFHLGSYSQVAVAVFFVLSGYVIAHVLATRETTAREYAASRLARLYSVVLPALILIAACNYIIELRYPSAFRSFDSLGAAADLAHYLGTALFVNQYWLWPPIEPPNADAFWSLSFEASYYVGIGLFAFARGSVRVCGLVLLAAAAGPSIVLLAPTWLLGYGIYHYAQHHQMRLRPALVIWAIFTLALAACPLIRENLRERISSLRLPDKTLGEILAFYAAAICFSLSLAAFAGLADKAELLLVPFFRLVRWLGSLTFALYLFHQPLLIFLRVYSIGPPASPLKAAWLAGGVLVVVATLGRLCERSKGTYKALFTTMLGGTRRAC